MRPCQWQSLNLQCLCHLPADQRWGVGAVQRRLPASGSGRSLLHHLRLLPRREDHQVRDKTEVREARLGFKAASSPSLSSSSSSSRQVPEEREASRDRQGEAALLLHHPGPAGQLHGATPPSLTTGFTPPPLKNRTLVCPRLVLCLCKYFFCWFFTCT